MKRFLIILLAAQLCLYMCAPAYASATEELVVYDSVSEILEDETAIEMADEESEIISCNITEEVAVDIAELYSEERLYNSKNVFDMVFPDTASREMLSESNNDVMLSWINENYIKRVTIQNKNASLFYGASDAPDRIGEVALKLLSSSALTSDVTNNYCEIYIAGSNPEYSADTPQKSWPLITTGDMGYAEFSFDFYTDGKTNSDLKIGRYFCADDSGNLSEVNQQTFWSLSTGGSMKMLGTEIKTVDTASFNNKWHSIKFKITADNKYQVFLDGEAITDLTPATFGGKLFRGISHFRLYNVGKKGISSEKYFDNFSYVVYEDITDEYKLPEVSFDGVSSDVISVEEGQEYTVRAIADTLCPKNINVYLDGDLVQTYDGKSCEYIFIGTVGSHILEIEAVDKFGAVSDKASITFNVVEKITIFGEFDGGETSGSYTDPDERVVNFDASCDKGFERTDIYVNGVLAETFYNESIMFDFSSFGTGTIEITAVVYDSLGKSKSFEYTADVVMNKNSLLWSENYDKYTTGSTSLNGGNIQIVHKNGYSMAVDVDEAHGKSMALGIEQDIGSDSGEYVNFVNPRPTDYVTFETEFYVSDYPASDAHIRVCMIESGSVQNNNIIRLGDNIYRTGAQMEYSPDTWYKLRMDFNMPQKTYSIYINDEPFIENVDFSKEKSNFEKLNYIRVYGPAKDGVPCYIAFDNSSLSVYESYSVTSVSGSNSENIAGGDNSFKFALSEQVNPDSLTPDSISVTNGDVKWRVEKVEYDKELSAATVVLKDRLIGGRDYVLELSGNIQTSSGAPLGEKICTTFSAEKSADVSFVASVFESDILSAELKSKEKTTAYIICTLWDGNIYKDVFVDCVQLETGSNTIDISLSGAEPGNNVQICIVKSLSEFKLMTDDILNISL